MGVYIPNMEKPKNAFNCSIKINPEERRCIYTGKVFEETLSLLIDRPCDDCPLIEIDLVRCGECKKHGKNSCPMTFTYALITDDNNYCSYAERRAE